LKKRIWCFVITAILACGVSYSYAASVAVVLSVSNDAVQAFQDGFSAYCSEKGIPLQQTIYNLREKDAATISGLVQAQQPSLVVALGSDAVALVKSGLSSIPCVYSMVTNNQGFDSASVTGVSIDVPANLRIGYLKSVLPASKRIGVLYSPAKTATYNEIADAGKAAGLTVIGRSVSTEAEFTPALQVLMGGAADCLLMIIDSKVYFGQTVKVMLLESLKNKVPVVGISGMFTKAGALMSVDCDYRDVGRQAGELAGRVIGGESPGSIKSQRPRKARYSLNLVTANSMGVSLPASVVSEASEVFR
jgi:putative ABC transport system substrate-binding protein